MTERALPVTILEPAGIDPELLDHSLSLRFDLGQFDPRITFTRNSSATYFGSDGLLKTASANEPRIDYDPVTGECKGFLVEEARTNLLTYSEQFDSTTWGKFFSTVTLTNEILSPTGAANAYKIVRTSSEQPLALRKPGLPLPAGTTYSASIYIYVPEQSGVTSWSMTNDYAGIEHGSTPTYTVFNKWVRVSTTSTLGAERNFVDFNVRVNGIQTPPAGFVFYIWGAQLEAGSFPTSYIKTEATTATRTADVAVMTGTNFSSWYRQDEGTVFIDYNIREKLAASRALGISDEGETNRLEVIGGSGSAGTIGSGGYIFLVSGGVPQASIPGGATNTPNANYRNAMSYKTNDVDGARNGVAGTKDIAAVIPVMNRMYLGANAAGGAHLSGTIKRVAFYPKKLSTDQLVALTA